MAAGTVAGYADGVPDRPEDALAMPHLLFIVPILLLLAAPAPAQQATPKARPSLGTVHEDRARIDGETGCTNIISPLNARGGIEIFRCFAGRHRTVQYSVRREPGAAEKTAILQLTWQRWHGRRSTGASPPEDADREVAIALLRRLTASFIGADEIAGIERSEEYFLGREDRTLQVGGLEFRYRFRRGAPFHRHILEVRAPPPPSETPMDRITEAAAGDVRMCLRIIQKARQIDGADLEVKLPPTIRQKEVAYAFDRENGERYLCRILNRNYFTLEGARDADSPLKALAHGRLKNKR